MSGKKFLYIGWEVCSMFIFKYDAVGVAVHMSILCVFQDHPHYYLLVTVCVLFTAYYM